MPDPQRVGKGGIKLSGGKVDFNDPKMKSAQSACQKYMQIGGGETLDPAKRAKLQESALNYARCMRGQGVDMPDPKLAGNGGLTFQAGPGSGPKRPNGSGPQGPRGQPRLAQVQGRRQGVQSLPGRPSGRRARARSRRSERRRPQGRVGSSRPPPRRPRRAGRGRTRRHRGRRLAAARARRRPRHQGGQRRVPLGAAAVSAATSSTARTSTARWASPTRRRRPPRPPAPSRACATRATPSRAGDR